MPDQMVAILWRKLTWTDLQAMSAGYTGSGGGPRHVVLSSSDDVAAFFDVESPTEDESVTHDVPLVPIEGVAGSEGPLHVACQGSRRGGEWRIADQHNNRYPLWSAAWGLKDAPEFGSKEAYAAGDPQVLLILKDQKGGFHARLLKSYDDGLLARLPRAFAEALRNGSNFGVFTKAHELDLPMPVEADVDAGVPAPGSAGFAGQGYANDSAVRIAIELHAMERAKEYFENEGWTVTDVSRTHPYDLQCTRQDEELHVEVKGTSGLGHAVFLTQGEVLAARQGKPKTALFIVSNIVVGGDPPAAEGGHARLYLPWDVDQGTMEPIQFRYIPPGSGHSIGA